MKIRLALAASLMAVTLFSCGKDEKSSGTASELDGTWTQGCTADDGQYTTSSLAFSGSSSVSTFKYFSDANCTTEALSIVATGSLTLGAAVTAPAGAKEVNKQVSLLTVTLKTDETVASWNGTTPGSTATCGGGFVKGTAKELTATTCANDGTFKSLFDQSFDIYKIDGTKLYGGACGDSGTATDCSAATKRPTSLETTFYTKS